MESISHVTIHLLASSARRGVNRKWLDPSSRTFHKWLVPYRRLPHIKRASRFWTRRFFLILSCLFDRIISCFQKKTFNRGDIYLASLRKRIKSVQCLSDLKQLFNFCYTIEVPVFICYLKSNLQPYSLPTGILLLP
jgi:hypothetical protein